MQSLRHMDRILRSHASQLRLDPLSCLVSFLPKLCCHVLFFHHTEVQILGFGGLMSAVYLGRVTPSLLPAALQHRVNAHSHIILACVFFLVAVSNRYAMLLAACFAIGVLKDWTASAGGAAAVVKENPKMSHGVEARKTLMYSSFAIIITGFLYRENARFPALLPCLLAALVFLYIAYGHSSDARHTRGKRATKFSSLGGVGVGGTGSAPQSSAQSQDHELESVGRGASVSAGGGLAVSTISASDVPMSEVPAAYLAMWGSAAAAHKRYVETLRWREEHRMAEITRLHMPFFREVLRHYPHAIHGRSLDGCVVLYEMLGKVRTPEMARLGVTSKDILWHMILRNEFVFQRCFPPSPAPTGGGGEQAQAQVQLGQIMTVVDVAGVRVADISVDVLSFIKQNIEVMDLHYPGRVRRLVICNAPYWFYSVWGMVSSILPDAVKKKIRIIGDVRGLDEFIAPAQRPAEYGGSSGLAVGQSPEQLEFAALPDGWTEEPPPPPMPLSQTKATESESDEEVEWAAGAGDNSGGVLSWLFGARSSRSSATQQAYLGDQNCFSYDPATQRWELDPSKAAGSRAGASADDSGNNGSSGGGNYYRTSPQLSSAQEIEEHGLVLAIQAAHAHLLGLEEGDIESGAGSTREDVGGGVTSSAGGTAEELGSEDLAAAFGLGEEHASSKVSAHVFLVCALLHLFGCLFHTGAVSMVPVWLVLRASRGGLQKTSADCAVLLSAVALGVFLLRAAFGARVGEAARINPVRTARIASAFTAMASFLLPWVALRGDGDYGLLSGALLVVAGAALAGLVCATYMHRRAASSLLFVCLSASFTSPATIVYFVGGFADVVGPFLMAMILASVFRLGARYPIDASFFLFILGSTSMLLYTAAMLLEVQFRGDSGLVSDAALLLSASRGEARRGGPGPRRRNSHQQQLGGGAVWESLQTLLRVPLEDLQFLRAPTSMRTSRANTTHKGDYKGI